MLLEGTIGLVGSVLGAALAALSIHSTLQKPVVELRKRVSELEAEKVSERLANLAGEISGLKDQVTKHLGDDKSQRILTLLETMQAEVSKMTAKIDQLCQDTARQAAQIAATDKYVANLDASFERHKAIEEARHGT